MVLKDESLKPTTQNQYCTIETGKWYSYYNDATYKKASALQIDHTVPVENVWISGGLEVDAEDTGRLPRPQ